MAKSVKLAEAGGTDYENLPPTFYLKFTKEEFSEFLANPTKVMKELGHNVSSLTVTVRDHAWVPEKREWVRELPPAANWQWWCGYEDEMCVCYQVLVP